MRAGQAVNIIEVIFAILIPPLGVFLHEGELNTRFWVSVLLTLLFVIPGIIYALLVVTDSI
ncbi:hydrogenase expression protein [Rufibacter sp. DG15C]|nr:hydrogenase expression protein [Rufibacter sp. DG15C]